MEWQGQGGPTGQRVQGRCDHLHVCQALLLALPSVTAMMANPISLPLVFGPLFTLQPVVYTGSKPSLPCAVPPQ